MTEAARKDFRLGFLTSVALDGGYVGGLLVTNHQGRPLEFQCTAPVRPNRMQEILYGPTLESFVLGELIGQTLLEKVSVKPHLVLTDQPGLLDLRGHVTLPVAAIDDESSDTPATKPATLGRQTLRFHPSHAADRDAVAPCANLIPRDADLKEPFDRVREALREAMGAKV